MKVDKSKWRKATLGEVCYIQMGQSPESSTYNESGDGLPFYQGNADFGAKHPIPRVFCNAPKKIANQGDILMSVRAPIGAVNMANTMCAIGRGLSAISPKDGICCRGFIQYLIISKNIELNKLGTGSVFKAINKANLHNLSLNLPAIAEQLGIVAELDRIQGLIDWYKAQIADLDALAQSIFLDTFGDPVTNPKGWEIKKLSEICDCISTGITFKPENVSEIGTIVLRSGNIQDSELILGDIIRVNVSLKPFQHVKMHDILMCSRNGSERLVGKVALIPNLNEEMTWGAFMTIIRSEYYCYLYHFFKLQAFKDQLGRTKTTTVNQITIGMLKGIKVPLPPLALQELFAARVKAIEALKGKLREQVADCELLMAERMQEYFS